MTLPSIALHIGAHKTATSHLQRCLKKASVPLAEAGVHYYGPAFLRQPGQSIPAMFGLSNAPDAAPAPRTPAEQLAQLCPGGHRLVLSEENFIGALNAPKGKARHVRYKAAQGRVGAFAAAVGRDVDVFLALRSPTAFTNSAYCQYLLGGSVQPVGTFVRRNPLSSVDWLDLVQRLRGALGVGQLYVWRHEDYAAVFPQITAAMVGAAHAPLVPNIARRVNAGLSAAAVAEILHRAAHDPMEKTAMGCRDMLSVNDGYPAFDAFSPEDHAASDVIYAAQVAGIAAMDGVRFLQPART
ncbi:MAG: hypothetical protein ACSHW1_16460 [Yoonia sp.]|uniref:hypothetical protein n=1 Tax=Yoonia sp. TaxID=2212373 RepID=UPI003EF66BAD